MTRAPLRITPGGIAATVLVLVVAAACVRLGFWQLDRLEQRDARNLLVAERLARPPVPITTAGADTTGLAYRRVELRGEYDHDRSFVLAGRAYDGVPGVHVITPLRLEGSGGFVLVNRGWLPSGDAATVDLAPYRESGPVHVTGIATPFFPAAERSKPGAGSRGAPVRVANVQPDPGSPAPRAWFRPDGDEIRATLPYPVADFVVHALPDPQAPARPLRLPPPELDRGPHLGYAIQWFSFAAIALGGWATLALRRGDARPRKKRVEA